jgi:hypothetical protein
MVLELDEELVPRRACFIPVVESEIYPIAKKHQGIAGPDFDQATDGCCLIDGFAREESGVPLRISIVPGQLVWSMPGCDPCDPFAADRTVYLGRQRESFGQLDHERPPSGMSVYCFGAFGGSNGIHRVQKRNTTLTRELPPSSIQIHT